MSFMSAVGEGIGALAGDLPKAVLLVRKYQKNMTQLYTLAQLNEEKKKAQEAVKGMTFTEKENGPSIADQQAAAEKGLVNDFLNNALLQGAAGTDAFLLAARGELEGKSYTNGSTSYDAIKQAAGGGLVAMEVQYNPSTIFLETRSGVTEMNDSSLDNMANTQIRQFNCPAVTNLSFQLVFDAMNQMDAFGMDASMLSTGGAASLIMDGMKKFGKDDSEGFSVRTQVEGLIASLFSPVTRRVIFCWAGMVFMGEMLQVNAKYTMFNKVGNPIRATVDITIQQNEDSEEVEKNSVWYKAFDKVFGTEDISKKVGEQSKWDKAKDNALLNFSI